MNHYHATRRNLPVPKQHDTLNRCLPPELVEMVFEFAINSERGSVDEDQKALKLIQSISDEWKEMAVPCHSYRVTGVAVVSQLLKKMGSIRKLEISGAVTSSIQLISAPRLESLRIVVQEDDDMNLYLPAILSAKKLLRLHLENKSDFTFERMNCVTLLNDLVYLVELSVIGFELLETEVDFDTEDNVIQSSSSLRATRLTRLLAIGPKMHGSVDAMIEMIFHSPLLQHISLHYYHDLGEELPVCLMQIEGQLESLCLIQFDPSRNGVDFLGAPTADPHLTLSMDKLIEVEISIAPATFLATTSLNYGIHLFDCHLMFPCVERLTLHALIEPYWTRTTQMFTPEMIEEYAEEGLEEHCPSGFIEDFFNSFRISVESAKMDESSFITSIKLRAVTFHLEFSGDAFDHYYSYHRPDIRFLTRHSIWSYLDEHGVELRMLLKGKEIFEDRGFNLRDRFDNGYESTDYHFESSSLSSSREDSMVSDESTSGSENGKYVVMESDSSGSSENDEQGDDLWSEFGSDWSDSDGGEAALKRARHAIFETGSDEGSE